jgi:hypothetical protein
MSAKRKPKKRTAKKRSNLGPRRGSSIIYPKGVEERYGISPVTRWRWEQANRLPARDAYIAGRPAGWKPETLDRADAGPTATAAVVAQPAAA